MPSAQRCKKLISLGAVILLTLIYAKNMFGIVYPPASPKARVVEFTYEIEVPGIPGGARSLKMWVPAASENPYQDVTLEAGNPIAGLTVVRDKIFNNKILYYLFESPEGDIRVNVDYKVRRYERQRELSGARLDNEKKEGLAEYLASNRLMVVSGEIKEMAARIVKDKVTTMEKARAIYDYVIVNLAYDKSIPGWGNGDTMRACSVKAGNCTDFHSLFVSLARAAGIPAKFVMGFSVPKGSQGEIGSYHCWAEFYDDRHGWVPVDVSEAWKNREKIEYYFGNLDEDRIEFTEGRDIILEPPANAGPLNYFIYPYAELDGRPVENVKVNFRFKEIPE